MSSRDMATMMRGRLARANEAKPFRVVRRYKNGRLGEPDPRFDYFADRAAAESRLAWLAEANPGLSFELVEVGAAVQSFPLASEK